MWVHAWRVVIFCLINCYFTQRHFFFSLHSCYFRYPQLPPWLQGSTTDRDYSS
jgi:hypothetical protein